MLLGSYLEKSLGNTHVFFLLRVFFACCLSQKVTVICNLMACSPRTHAEIISFFSPPHSPSCMTSSNLNTLYRIFQSPSPLHHFPDYHSQSNAEAVLRSRRNNPTLTIHFCIREKVSALELEGILTFQHQSHKLCRVKERQTFHVSGGPCRIRLLLETEIVGTTSD